MPAEARPLPGGGAVDGVERVRQAVLVQREHHSARDRAAHPPTLDHEREPGAGWAISQGEEHGVHGRPRILAGHARACGAGAPDSPDTAAPRCPESLLIRRNAPGPPDTAAPRCPESLPIDPSWASGCCPH
jgi:hypothetical protein